MTTLWRTGLVAVASLMLGVLLTVGYLQTQTEVAMGLSTAPTATPAERAAAPAAAPAKTVGVETLYDEDVVVEIYKRTSPSVVNITSRSAMARGQFSPELPFGTGSGFIIDEEGLILTNNHVVANATGIDVTLAEGTTLPAEVLGTDPGSDLAVLKIDLPREMLDGGRVTVARLGDSDRLQVGQMAIAIGNPFGFERTVTVGVVSGVGRDIPTDRDRPIRGGIQTDAAINPGNSGGPLLNSAGEVIGINTAIESPVRGSVGVGFAVPVNTAKRHLDALIAGREIEHPWLGITGLRVTNQMADELGLGVRKGVYILQVAADSPADRAGLAGAVPIGRPIPTNIPRGGDVITAIDGQEVFKVEQIAEHLGLRKSVGDTVELTVHRDGQQMTITATLAAWPSS